MQLTKFTDYSLRVLIYLGLKNDLSTVGEIASAFRVSRHHLVKVVHQLSRLGLVESRKGKTGGIRLATQAREMTIGELVAKVEPHFHLVECFDVAHNTCPIQGYCGLESLLYEAQRNFISTLNRVTLAQLFQSQGRDKRREILDIK